MVEDILHNCRPQTRLCIAANITCEGEYVRTKTIKEWQGKVPDLTKIPCIFSYTNNLFQVFIFQLKAFAEEVSA